jgi:hypothetical protein
MMPTRATVKFFGGSDLWFSTPGGQVALMPGLLSVLINSILGFVFGTVFGTILRFAIRSGKVKGNDDL